MRTHKHTDSKAKTTRSRSSRPARFGYGITGISLVTILAMQAVKSDFIVSEHKDTVPENTTVSVPEDVVEVSIDLQAMTKGQLLEHAEKVGIIVRKSWTKTKMIETLSV
jgi:hypothetical protein